MLAIGITCVERVVFVHLLSQAKAMTQPALEIRHLALLAAVDELGSLNAAARRLHLSPSALSQQLRELEVRLGGPLFTRQWRSLVLNAAGRRLTDSAHAILDELVRTEAETRALLSGARGTIRLTTVCQQSYQWLPKLLRAFGRKWPDIEVTIVAEAAERPNDWLCKGRLDVALVAGDSKPDPRVRVVPLFRDELVALVGQGHPWFGRRTMPVRALADEHMWVDQGAFQPGTPLGQALAEAGNLLPRKVTWVPMNGAVQLEMARANLGITVVPRWTVEPALGGGDLHVVRLGRRGVWLDWSVATRAEAPAASLAGFLDALSAHHPRAAADAPAPRTQARPARG